MKKKVSPSGPEPTEPTRAAVLTLAGARREVASPDGRYPVAPGGFPGEMSVKLGHQRPDHRRGESHHLGGKQQQQQTNRYTDASFKANSELKLANC